MPRSKEGLYSEDEAREEAGLLSKMVESGQAKNYNEAEQQLEKNESMEHPQLQSAIAAYLLQREDYYKRTYPNSTEAMLDGEKRMIQNMRERGGLSNWQPGEGILECITHNIVQNKVEPGEPEKPIEQKRKSGWISMRPGDHEKWIALMKYQDSILARPLSGQSIDDLRTTRDILTERLEGAKGSVDSLTDLLNVDVPLELKKDTESVMGLAYQAAEKSEKDIEKYAEELEIVNGLIKKKEGK